MRLRSGLFVVSLLLWNASAFGDAANGKLQIHHIDVGQGDGAVLISPKGEVVLFDMGEDMKRKDCQPAVAYLDQLGIDHIDYLFVSHYHFDHIGCIPTVLNRFQLKTAAYDRGGSYNGATFGRYVASVGSKRQKADLNSSVTLDKGSQNPITLSVVAVNGKSKTGSVATSNENDLSLAMLVSFGNFREEIGGDLSGDDTGMYQDIETPVSASVGGLDVYKVHHHCSSHSTNHAWLDATRPTIAVISTGDGNDYDHPTEDCLQRLHEAGLERVYWTERGAGGSPTTGVDVVSGDVRIEVAPGAATYTVAYEGGPVDTYHIKTGATGGPASVSAEKKYAWSNRSAVYHIASCPDVRRILQENLSTGETPPTGKRPAACVQGN